MTLSIASKNARVKLTSMVIYLKQGVALHVMVLKSGRMNNENKE